MFSLIALVAVVAVIGLMAVPQNAYAGFEEEIDHGEVVAVHCELAYEFEMFLIFGERYGYGECIYIYPGSPIRTYSKGLQRSPICR